MKFGSSFSACAHLVRVMAIFDVHFFTAITCSQFFHHTHVCVLWQRTTKRQGEIYHKPISFKVDQVTARKQDRKI
jgi:hypothetical protein